jgi:hypothetical protein
MIFPLRRWTPLFLCITGIISSTISHHTISLFVFTYLCAYFFQLVSDKSDSLLALGVLASTGTLFAIVFFLIGQHICPVNNFFGTAIIYLVLSLPLIYLEPGENHRNRFRCSIASAAFVSVSSLFLFRLEPERLISFLGFGYDNYGHLSAVRQILLRGGSFVDSVDPSEYVTFVGNTPLGAHSVLAFLGQAAGIRGGDVESSIVLLSLANLGIPVLFLFTSYLILNRNKASLWRPVLSLFIVSSIYLVGYPSHTWFSGFFASNFGALLIVISIGVGLSSAAFPLRLAIQLMLLAGMLHIYLLFAGLGIVILVSQVISLNRESLRGWFSSAKKYRTVISVFLVLLFLLGLIAFGGIVSGYGTGHFLAAGGIAPLPIGTTSLIFGMAAFLNFPAANDVVEKRFLAVMLSGLVLAASTGISYAFLKTQRAGEHWFVPYYPTKVAVLTMLICVLFQAEFITESVATRPRKLRVETTRLLLIVGSFVALLYAGFNRWPFTQGYMSTVPGVFYSVRHKQVEPVEGGLVMSWVRASNKVNRPVLVLSKNHESELNSRWVNSLTLRWNDDSWGTWIAVRDAISTGKLSDAQRVASSELLIVSDDRQLIADLGSFGNGVLYCLFDESRLGGCRPKWTEQHTP